MPVLLRIQSTKRRRRLSLADAGRSQVTEVDPVRHPGDHRPAIAGPVLSVLQMPDAGVAFGLICRIACLSDRIKRFVRLRVWLDHCALHFARSKQSEPELSI
jgi:hypothetical protein